MNNTKWNELRLAMYSLGSLRPRWRAKDLSGYLSPWDGDWFYHFHDGGYESIDWVEIQVVSPEQETAVLALLQAIHLPGTKTDQGFRIDGYSQDKLAINYI